MKPRYMITTAISYPNGVPHIGHAYELIAADVLARFKRLDGYDVFFLTGTDEHGQKIQQTAAKEGLSAAELVERNTPRFAAMAEAFLGSHDDFIRTTEERHKQSVQAIWKAMEARGDIYLSTYTGWYSTRDEAFYAEDETEVRADGVRYGPQGTPVAWMEENSYFFRLSKYQDALLAHYEAHPEFIQPEARRNEVISFVKSGLKDLSISRTTFDWGIPVPDAPGHIMYVWVDALTNYITGAGYPNTSSPRWPYWPADVHIIGKDIIRFHAVYWPAFLMSAGLPLPKTVFGHGFLFNRGEKMSKSLGNVVDPFGMIETYGVDAVRYFFLREVPFGQDGSYSHEAIVNRTNADLANDLGNLAQRSLSMIAKNCGSQVPQPEAFSPDDTALLQQCSDLWGHLQEHMARYALHDALGSIMAVVSEANRYFAAQEPWALKKTDPERMNTVLYVTIEVLRQVGILLSPFLPQASTKLLAALGQEVDTVHKGHLTQALKPHSPLPAPQPLFPRYVEPETTNNAG